MVTGVLTSISVGKPFLLMKMREYMSVTSELARYTTKYILWRCNYTTEWLTTVVMSLYMCVLHIYLYGSYL